MILFILLYFLLALGAYTKCNNQFVYVIFCLFSIIIGFRGYEVGADTHTYVEMYDRVTKFGYNGYPEPLYGLIEELCAWCGFDFSFFQLVLCILMFSFIWKTINKSSSNKIFSLFVFYSMYFVMYAMNVTRQIIAVSILLYGYSFLAKNQKLKFLLCVLIALGFHNSSIFALAALFVRKINLKSNIITMVTICSIFIGTILPLENMTEIAGTYGHYLLSDTTGIRSSGRLAQAFILCTFWSALFLYVYKKSNKDGHQNFWTNLFFTGIIINNLFIRSELGLRFVWVFSIANIIAIPILIKNSKSSLSTKTSAISLLGVFFFTLLFTNSANIFPYQNILLKYFT